jgi:hypothetical protein
MAYVPLGLWLEVDRRTGDCTVVPWQVGNDEACVTRLCTSTECDGTRERHVDNASASAAFLTSSRLHAIDPPWQLHAPTVYGTSAGSFFGSRRPDARNETEQSNFARIECHLSLLTRTRFRAAWH